MATLRPQVFVELGTHKGDSYASFCQAVDHLSLTTACYAVDTWRGDDHAGYYDDSVYETFAQYHDARYSRFSQLLRLTFDEAADYFSDGSIDLLHIDGLHSYEAVRHDFETWLPKLTDKAVVLLHDVNVRQNGFGVWRFWEEITQQYPHFAFLHSYGLGILAVGTEVPETFAILCQLATPQAEPLQALFGHLGEKVGYQRQALEHEARLHALQQEMETLRQTLTTQSAQLVDRDAEKAQLLATQTYNESLRQEALEHEARLHALQQEMETLRQTLTTQSAQLVDRDAEKAQLLHRIENALPTALNVIGIKALPELIESWRCTRTWRLSRHLSFFSNREITAMFDRALLLARNIAQRADEPIPPAAALQELQSIVTCLAASRAFQMSRTLSALSHLIRLRSPARGSFERVLAITEAMAALAGSYSAAVPQGMETLHQTVPVPRQLAYRNHGRRVADSAALVRERAAWANKHRIGVFLLSQHDCPPDAIAVTIADILKGTFSDITIEIIATQNTADWRNSRVIQRLAPLSPMDLMETKYDYFLIANAGDRFDRSFLSRCMGVSGGHTAVYCDYNRTDFAQTVTLPDWDHVWIKYQNYVQAPVLWNTSRLIEMDALRAMTEPMKDARAINWELLRKMGRNDVAHLAESLVSIPTQDLQMCAHEPKRIYRSVSIIIPTNGSNLGLLRQCLESIIAKTVYPGQYEILLLDNSRKSAMRGLYDYFDEVSDQGLVRCIEADIEFNWSALNNLGVKASTSDIFVFLNDDTEVINPQWLTDLIDVFQWPSVGVVGAQLLFPDGTIQHAGVTLVSQGGGAVHIGYKNPPHMLGMWNSAPRSVIAVTGACQAVTREAYNSVGGFNEDYLVVSSDIAFCLAMRHVGYEIVYNPTSLLYHHEMVSRKKADFPIDTELFWDEWGEAIKAGDPYYPDSFRKLPADFAPDTVNVDSVTVLKSPFVSSEDIKNLLVVKIDHLGDVFLAKEAVQRLKSRMPKATVHVVCAPWAKAIFEDMGVGNILTCDIFAEKSDAPPRAPDKAQIADLERSLLALQIDVAVDLRRHPESRRILDISGALMTVGYESGEFWPVICMPQSNLVRDRATVSIGKPHIGHQLLWLTDMIPIVHCGSRFRHPIDGHRPTTIGIHPGSGSDARQWGADMYARLARMAIAMGWRVRLYGGQGERITNSVIMEEVGECDGRIEDCGSRISILDFAKAVQEQCDIYIGNNSGPTHMVAATGMPVIALYGGFVDPYEWFPPGPNVKVMLHATTCAPCYLGRKQDCGLDRICLRGVLPHDVLNECKRSIDLSITRKWSAKREAQWPMTGTSCAI